MFVLVYKRVGINCLKVHRWRVSVIIMNFFKQKKK